MLSFQNSRKAYQVLSSSGPGQDQVRVRKVRVFTHRVVTEEDLAPLVVHEEEEGEDGDDEAGYDKDHHHQAAVHHAAAKLHLGAHVHD